MFKQCSFEDEIFHSMEKQLVNSNLEQEYNFTKIAKALDFLNMAAEMFEKADMQEEAIEVTNIIKGLTKQL